MGMLSGFNYLFWHHHPLLLLNLLRDVMTNVLNRIVVLLDNLPWNHVNFLLLTVFSHTSFLGHLLNPGLVLVFYDFFLKRDVFNLGLTPYHIRDQLLLNIDHLGLLGGLVLSMNGREVRLDLVLFFDDVDGMMRFFNQLLEELVCGFRHTILGHFIYISYSTIFKSI